MAIHSQSSGNWVFSLKALLISAVVLSAAGMLKVSVPVIAEFVFDEVPLIWRIVHSWLRPPYLYLVINCIIISIVASSKLQSKVEEPPVVEAVKDPGGVRMYYSAPYDSVVSNVVRNLEFEMLVPGAEFRRPVEEATPFVEMKTTANVTSELSGGDELAVSRSSTPQRKESAEYSLSTEKPPVSMRFGHRKTVKASPEAKALGVSRPKRHDTLESTWKTITDGRPMPLTRHLKKSDTWETHARYSNADLQDQTSQKVKKSETFNDRSSTNSPLTRSSGSGKLKREPSLGQDELNRRVEAFIKKFNEEMRLQRQESLNQYHEMISRGSH